MFDSWLLEVAAQAVVTVQPGLVKAAWQTSLHAGMTLAVLVAGYKLYSIAPRIPPGHIGSLL